MMTTKVMPAANDDGNFHLPIWMRVSSFTNGEPNSESRKAMKI